MKFFVSIFLLTFSVALCQVPKVVTPTLKAGSNRTYPWKKNITATIFWIGEKPTPKNPVPNNASSWDTEWQKNFGGFDDPNNRAAVGYRPAAFIPKLNPFYIALPYNDRYNHKYIKPEAPHVIPWYSVRKVQKGASCLKGRWLQIVYDKKICYAQWEDCGPFNTTDYEYVFGNKRPKNYKNQGAGIDLSPAVRDFLSLQSGAKVHWRFVEESQVPSGPWRMYGTPKKIAKAETRVEKYRREMRELNAQIEANRLERNRKLDQKLEQLER